MIGGTLPASAYPRPGLTELISVTTDGVGDNPEIAEAAIRADGRYVAFDSLASNLVPDDTNKDWDVFVRDRQKGTSTRVSVASDGTQASGSGPDISADGRSVAFGSNSENLMPGGNGLAHAFVHDWETGTTERVSVSSDGTEAGQCLVLGIFHQRRRPIRSVHQRRVQPRSRRYGNRGHEGVRPQPGDRHD